MKQQKQPSTACVHEWLRAYKNCLIRKFFNAPNSRIITTKLTVPWNNKLMVLCVELHNLLEPGKELTDGSSVINYKVKLL